MKLALVIVAMVLMTVAAYFVGSKRDKKAFQFLTEDNGNFSLLRLVVLLSNLCFLFSMIYKMIKTGELINPTWPLVAYMVFINLSKVLQKYFETHPEKINDIIQTLRK